MTASDGSPDFSGEEPRLPDGSYDAFVLDAADADGSVRLELTIVSGDHKGGVVGIVAPRLREELTDLVGMPATLTVAGGRPSVAIDT